MAIVFGKASLIQLDKADLPHRRRGLHFGNRVTRAVPFKTRSTNRNGAGANQDNLAAVLNQRRNLSCEVTEFSRTDGAVSGERAAPDLDHDSLCAREFFTHLARAHFEDSDFAAASLASAALAASTPSNMARMSSVHPPPVAPEIRKGLRPRSRNASSMASIP